MTEKPAVRKAVAATVASAAAAVAAASTPAVAEVPGVPILLDEAVSPPIPAGQAAIAPPPVAPPVVPPPVLAAVPLWAKIVAATVAPLALLAAGAASWSAWHWLRTDSDPSPPAIEETTTAAAPTVAEEKAPPPAAARPAIDRRWLPDRTALVFTICPGELVGQPVANRLIDQCDRAWQASFGALIAGLGLRAEAIQRLTLVSDNLAAWPNETCLIVDFADGTDLQPLAKLGRESGFSLAGGECRQMPSGKWQHPFAMVAPGTLVTGPESTMRALAARHEARLQNRLLDRLLGELPAEPAAALAIDLSAARASHWPLPTDLLDVWPAGKQAWHSLFELPEAMTLAVQTGKPLSAELALACDVESTAEKVRMAAEQLGPSAKRSVQDLLGHVEQRLKAGQINAAVATQYEIVLKQALAAIDHAQVQAAENIVRWRAGCSTGVAALAAAAIDARDAMHIEWLSAAKSADEANQRNIVGGLLGYSKAERQFPPGALGGSLLPVETRLSWIAAMLPYMNHVDWYEKLERGNTWNGPQNRPITSRPLPEVINPAFGPSATETGFPVTHYVGVAGLGEQAASLPRSDRRAGVFGAAGAVRPQDIADGASNTIAILGVGNRLGPWAAGGQPTVRGLTKAPYVNGPDGFSSGQPDGMLAGMADGSVRFISKDVDPRVLEALATIHGGESETVAALEPRPAGPAAGPAVPLVPDMKAFDVNPPAAEGPASHDQKADIVARLETPVAALELSNMPLLRAVRTVAALCNVPVALDPDAMLDLDVAPGDPVTQKLGRTTAGKMLEALAAEHGLIVLPENGYALLTTPAAHRQSLRHWEHPVADLIGGNPAAEAELVSLLQKFVVPDSWQVNAGGGTLKIDGGKLLLEQTEAVDQRVVLLLERLRAARGKPLQTQVDPDEVSAATHLDRAAPLLGKRLTANFRDGTKFGQALAFLEDTAQCSLLVDWASVAAAGVTAQSDVHFAVDKQPLAVALAQLLQPLGLDFRVVDAQTLQIGTPKSFRGRVDVEFYALATLLNRGQTVGDILQRIKSGTPANAWSDAGGPGTMQVDGPSRCLIVLQTQPVQAAIEALLKSAR